MAVEVVEEDAEEEVEEGRGRGADTMGEESMTDLEGKEDRE